MAHELKISNEEALAYLKSWKPEVKLLSVETIHGDASGRRYYRLLVDGFDYPSLVLMIQNGGQGPLMSGGSINQDMSFPLMQAYFEKNNIRVPKLYFDGHREQFQLLEDVGDLALWRFVLDSDGELVEEFVAQGHQEDLVSLYGKAVDVISRIQGCPPDETNPGFLRRFGEEELFLEARRFIDFLLIPQNHPESLVEDVEAFLRSLCKRVEKHPYTLIHRDFMPWNIQILTEGKLCLLDFQDSLQGSYVYDLVSLLHDRDIDFSLPAGIFKQMLERFCENGNYNQETVATHYCEALLQRHFRLAGQFLTLTQKTGRPHYAEWSPGCLYRCGQALACLNQGADWIEQFADINSDFEKGLKSPLVLC
jgi:aminoglycoside/choline kinase family phosphotransferase